MTLKNIILKKIKLVFLFPFIFFFAFTSTTLVSNSDRLELQVNFEEPQLVKDGNYLRVQYNSAEGSLAAGYTSDIGYPELPVIRRFIYLPYGVSVKVEVKNVVQTDKKIDGEIYPLQPPIPKYNPPMRSVIVKDANKGGK